MSDERQEGSFFDCVVYRPYRIADATCKMVKNTNNHKKWLYYSLRSTVYSQSTVYNSNGKSDQYIVISNR